MRGRGQVDNELGSKNDRKRYQGRWMITLLRQALYELVHHAIELHRIIDEERVSISVEPL
jgi:hypothetical protein